MNKHLIWHKDYDCDSTLNQFITAFVIIPLGVALPIAIASPVVTMIGDGLIGGVTQSMGYERSR